MRERKNGVIEWTMRHYQITLLVITVLVGLGILGLVDMPKQEFPEFTIRQGVVVGVYPGATSGEVEEQLAKPLERYLFTFKEVKKKKTYSMSRDGMVYVMVELNDDVNNKDEVWSKIKLGLQNFKSQLPSGVLAVIANDDFGDTSALLITLESEDKTYRELQRYMETLEDRLRRIESVSNLRRYGVQNEQISVYLDPDKLAAYGLDTRMLMTTLFTQGFTTASGSLENGGLDIPIHLSVTYPSEREVGEQILLADADGHMIRLKDVARIVREYPEPDSYITNNGKKAIILSMEMREGHNIVRYGKEVDEVLHAFERDLPESVSIRRIADQPKVVGDSVSSFVRDLFVSIVVVILVMMVLFPFRSALVAATSIPISVFISIGVMYACGIPLNTVTLAALIVVLGMIVDNSIVVLESCMRCKEEGMDFREAAATGTATMLMSILAGTLTTVVVYIPMAMAEGLVGMMTGPLSWTILLTLLCSFLCAVVVVPLAFLWLKPRTKDQLITNRILGRFKGFYRRTLPRLLRHPGRVVLVGGACFLAAILLMTQMEFVMMASNYDGSITVDVAFRSGTKVEVMNQRIQTLEDALLSDENFVPARRQQIVPTTADKEILADKGEPGYRVFNLTVSPFNDATTSYFHRSVGGYHGAKLSRYQDLIDRYLSNGDEQVLDMLNTRYLIVPGDDGTPQVVRRTTAFGAAWFVDSLLEASTPREEIELLGQVNLRTTAVVAESAREAMQGFRPAKEDSLATARITLTEYRPNRLVYEYSAPREAMALFSEIYYDKGWRAFVDGQEAPYFRADYLLRAMLLPEGDHTVEWRFRAPGWGAAETVTGICSALILLGAVAALLLSLRRRKVAGTDTEQPDGPKSQKGQKGE